MGKIGLAGRDLGRDCRAAEHLQEQRVDVRSGFGRVRGGCGAIAAGVEEGCQIGLVPWAGVAPEDPLIQLLGLREAGLGHGTSRGVRPRSL